MGPRIDLGVRSYACLVRSRELLRIAAKTRSPQILVFGNRWFRAVEGEDHTATHAQTELVRQLFRPGPPRIHIVTRPEGMLRVTLNALADATIYVKRAQDTERDRRIAAKNATFHADSLTEAFDIANRILGFFAAGLVPMEFAEPHRSPRIPDDPAQPFDMVADVVSAIVDEGSFLEFKGESGERSGSDAIVIRPADRVHRNR